MRLAKTIIVCICIISSIALANLLVSASSLQSIKKKYGQRAYQRVKSWQVLIKNDKDKSTETKLKLVNAYFNRLTYTTDQALVGKDDYWMTPLEFLIKGGGDCEDFAIAKYFTLKAIGIPESKLHLVYAKSIKYNISHMVLAYYATPSSVPLILDNLTNSILSGPLRRDLIPVYSFNAQGLWLAKQKSMGQQVRSRSRLSAWEEMLGRMRLENNK